jgi:AcrR family transcriptional regulator
MNSARLLFLEQGVAATTVEQITNRAKVAKGTFYLYFTSKEDVLVALGEAYGDDHLAAIRAAIEKQPPDDWRAKLSTWVRAGVESYLDTIHLHDILFFGSRPVTREGLVDNVVIDYLCDLLKAGAAAEAWSIDDPRFTAVFLFSGLHAAVDDAHVREKRINRGKLAEKLTDLCFHAIGLSSAI